MEKKKKDIQKKGINGTSEMVSKSRSKSHKTVEQKPFESSMFKFRQEILKGDKHCCEACQGAKGCPVEPVSEKK